MASKNKLILGPEIVEEEQIQPVQAKAPAWRYHSSCREGKVFKTDEALAAADKAGWKDHPGKVSLLPGHEKLFQESSKIVSSDKDED